MMAKTGEPFDSDDYVFEPKWDGLRALLFKQANRIALQNRNLRDVTASYPELQELASRIKARTAIVDGEAVILDENGLPDFGKMQNRFGINDSREARSLAKTLPVTYVAFDLLHINGKDLIAKPLAERKSRLKTIVQEGPHLLYGDHVEGRGRKFYQEASKKGFEGVIAKGRGSPYLPGVRADSWVKIKGFKTLDCVVVGFTQGEGMRVSSFGALVVAAYSNKSRQLQHVGNVGGGFDDRNLEMISSMLMKLARKTPTLEGHIDAPSPVTWLKPRLVCEVKYASITRDKKLRFPRFSRLRTDKSPEECQMDF
jgi:DNA ligase D-like protein (predicted ligase)